MARTILTRYLPHLLTLAFIATPASADNGRSKVQCSVSETTICNIQNNYGVRRVIVEQTMAGGDVSVVDAQIPACLPQAVVGWKAATDRYNLTIVTCHAEKPHRVPDVTKQVELLAVDQAMSPKQIRVMPVDRSVPGAQRRLVRIVSDTLPIAVIAANGKDQQALISHCGSPNAFCGDGFAGSACGIEDHQGQQSCPGTVSTPPDENGNPTGPYCDATC